MGIDAVIGSIVGGVVDAASAAAGAIGGVVSSIVPEAVAAETATGAADIAAATAADVGGATAADIAGATALPEIVVTPAAEAAAAGAGTEAALGGGAAAAATGTEAALAGETLGTGVGTALGGAAGAAGILGAAEGAFGGAGVPSTAGITAPVTAGVPTGAGAGAGAVSGGAAAPSDVLPSGPALAALGGTPVGIPGGGLGGASDVFANAPTATPGQIPSSLATAATTADTGGALGPGAQLEQTLQDPTAVSQLLAGTNVPQPQSLNIPASADVTTATTGNTSLSQYEGAVASPSNPNVGGQFGSPAPVAGGAAAPSAFSNLGSVLKLGGEIAPIAALGLTLARGQPSLPPAEQQALANTSGLQSFAQSQIQNAQNNQITPAQAAQIQTYTQNATNQLYQLYAREGRDPNNDSDYVQGVAQINANAIGMQQQFIDAMVQNGLTAYGVVDSTLQSAAQMQVASDQAFQQSVNSALQSFGLTAALSSLGSKTA